MPVAPTIALSTGRALIFVVEGDSNSGRLICDYLDTRGYVTRWFAETSGVLAQAKKTPPDLFLVDLLSVKSGLDLCRQIRETKALLESRIIFLIAKTSEVDAINGLELGGDAYITKPFSPHELLARVRTVLRRTPKLEPARTAKYGRIEIDVLAMTIKVEGKVVPTTVREFHLLKYLAQHGSRVFTRSQLLEAVWAQDAFVTNRSIDVYIRRLREKIEPDPENPVYLIAVRGVGYRFDIPR